MRLLIVTQTVNREDPILGFFHGWLERFAKETETLTVIAQSVGSHALPESVRVLSLGKESGASRSRQILRFWLLIWRERGRYDAVLVHMTPVWMVLGAKIWILLGKRRYLWYEIRRGGWMLRMSLLLTKKVFSATKDGLPFPSRKQVIVGHGIDINLFRPHEDSRQAHLVSTVGRVTEVKHHEVLLRAFASLPKTFQFILGGGTITKRDEETLATLERFMWETGIADRVQIGFLSQRDVIALLQKTELFLHACEGGLDKALLEAMACGCLVASSSIAAHSALPSDCRATHETMPAVAQRLIKLSGDRKQALRQELRAIVERDHSVDVLIPRLVKEMT